MYLVDTNIWLERLLEQDRSGEVEQFLDHVPSDQLLMTDFSLHSIALILTRLGRQADLLRFIQDLFVDGSVTVVTLEPSAMQQVVAAMDGFGLDFDDAYQYVAAQAYEATLVSFDRDFDRTPAGRVTPAEALAAM